MKIAYFSPLSPQRSGISDYSEELLPYLANGAEVTLFVDGFPPSNNDLSKFEVRDYRRKRSLLNDLSSFDAVVYHMGNDHRYHTGIFEAMKQHPGIVVFHDFVLQDFFRGLATDRNDIPLYLNEVEACHGKQARLEAAQTLVDVGTPSIVSQPFEFPLNRTIAEAAEGIIVHSDWSRKRFESSVPNVPIARIAHLAKLPDGPSQTPDSNKILNISTFGLITPDKGIEPSLRALSRLKAKHIFQYTLVGDTNQFYEVREIVRRYDMQDCVEITGHISLEEFKRRIDETDIALNIRERTVGETSGCLVRLLTAGICSVVAEEGWYAELPNDSVVKIPLDSTTDEMLVAYLDRLLADKPLRDRIGKNARAYAVEEFRAENRAADYLKFIRRIIDDRPKRRLVKSVSDELTSLHFKPTDESFLLGVAEEIAVLVGDETAEEETKSTFPKLPTTTQPQRTPSNGRLAIPGGIDYKLAAIDYLDQLNAEREHHLRTKPFYNLAYKLDKHHGEGMDADTHRHFCDFANIAVTLALPPGSKILDVGCGSGWLSEYFGRLGYQVTGIDISPKLIEMSRERVSKVPYGVDHETAISCDFKVHDIEDGPLAEQFDAAICYDSLHHFQDENAVMRNVAAMLPVGGVMFVLEGERPPLGSASEAELYEVMSKYGTLESPFDYFHLRQILDVHGFTVIGDYASVNGLFERARIVDDLLPLRDVAINYHYLLCKKIADGAAASTVADSLHPNLLRARFALLNRGPQTLMTGETLKIECEIENTGDTLWFAGSEIRTGVVMPGVRVIDDKGTIVKEFHGEPPLPRVVAPGEKVRIRIALEVLLAAGYYTLKLDLVNQHICWFEDVGNQPLTIEFEVI